MEPMTVLGHIQVLISRPGLVAVVAVLAVLLGSVWLLRGGRAVLRTCAAIGAAELTLGLAGGNLIQIGGGLVIAAVAAWELWPWHGSRRRR